MNVREIVSIFYPDSKAHVGELVVDAFVHETYAFSSETSEHPIENGSSIVDHVHNKPISLAIEGIISNTPMTLVVLAAFDSVSRYVQGESNDFASIAFEKIEGLFKKREPLSIATSLKTYDKMVLETLNVERGGGFFSDTLHFSCTAKQIVLVRQELIKVAEPKVERAKPKAKRGLQESKPIAKEQAESLKRDNSLLFSLGKKLLGGS
ncbi:hypothetical protein E6Q11_06220 [Candidatus Dojkabacteria bacterium]|uniref:Dit-like phage tail protein N-terminal domain-containing protein n=1 Tax=Candidatus Dojkabacteria bacterium TaxID=2099670 RepID=A0A5C7J2Y4_9BACT|nr:MAG: hypothetical protein E6Q11_06220 [Candidatus Dojkabacteria bacterium]